MLYGEAGVEDVDDQDMRHPGSHRVLHEVGIHTRGDEADVRMSENRRSG